MHRIAAAHSSAASMTAQSLVLLVIIGLVGCSACGYIWQYLYILENSKLHACMCQFCKHHLHHLVVKGLPG